MGKLGESEGEPLPQKTYRDLKQEIESTENYIRVLKLQLSS